MYDITIKNCNNIRFGEIHVEDGKTNIFYGINGTGKSTVAKAIKMSRQGEAYKSELQSYLTEEKPEVTITPECRNILVFDEDYVNNIVFKDNDVIEKPFEVFIKTDNYDIKKQALDAHLKSLHEIISRDDEIVTFQSLLKEILSKFKFSTAGKLNRTGTFKSMLSKSSIYNIPAELNPYKDFIQDVDKNIQWIDWKNKGDEYDTKTVCPYCSETIKREEHENRKSVFKSTFKKADSQNLKEILNLFEQLKDYLDIEKYDNLVSYIKSDAAEDVITSITENLISEISIIDNRLTRIVDFGNKQIAIADINSLDETVSQMSIPAEVFSFFGGEKVSRIFTTINTGIFTLKEEVEKLKQEMGALKGLMQATIRASQADINEFLRTAGIPYAIEIQAEDENNSKTVLRQCFCENHSAVTEIRKHLSWGEKNAFALILFMYYAVNQKPDMIILDDPISSFDENKKFAILHRLFKNIGRNDVSFERRTVLILTHDFEPLTDFLVIEKINSANTTGSYVWNENGTLKSKIVNADTDIKLIIQECIDIAKNNTINIVSRIAFLRRLSELHCKNNNWGTVYEVLSCLMHGSPIRRKIGHDTYESIPEEDISFAETLIQEYIPEYNYENLKNNIYNKDVIKTLYSAEQNTFFKMQLFREYTELDRTGLHLTPQDEAWNKYIDETYHIENSQLYLLDVLNFQVVPEYIIKIADSIMNAL